jgi:hypothetical protein
MKDTIKKELTLHILDYINDGIVNNENIEEAHFYCFNEDYYIIGYYEAKQWLKKHNIDAFEAIDIVREYENDHFGEFTTDINPASIVNVIAYIYGEEIFNSYDFDTVEELKTQIENK